ncbi:hypothetical protein [Streptoalloteichus hindustanus]|uniref:Uncharacterized protein n=1 Tax=Streptoalloteichus hindustanus TaxID=2017 RepID=A0A1M5BC00_STRHI|nr:hypothetical protein [Streptoalloteichus hindustanus]SHF39945.1 hypothetical protein SAMN05444320_103498 [Streptoalloteichus hindustanus]
MVPVDTKLERKDGVLKPKAAVTDSRVPERSGPGAVIRAQTRDGASAELEPIDFAVRDAKRDGSTAVYEGVQDGVDLKVRVLNRGFKQDLVLHKAPSKPEWKYRLRVAANLEPKPEKDGSIAVKDGAGKARLVIPAPTVWDASGMEPVREPVSQRLERDDKGWLVVLSVDSKWLSTQGRKYPVTVDPALSDPHGYGPNVYTNTYVSDGWPDQNYSRQLCADSAGCVLKVGYYPGAGNNRAYVNYNIDPIRGKQILHAEWRGYWMWSSQPGLALGCEHRVGRGHHDLEQPAGAGDRR